MSKYLIGAVVSLLVVVAVGGAYMAGRGQLPGFNKDNPLASPVASVQPSVVPSPFSSPAGAQQEDTFGSSDKTIETIEASIASKNYQALEAYMTDPVNVVLYASECCEPESPAKAVAQLDYLSSGTPPWNFKDNNPIAAKLKANSEYFKNSTVIGTSSNRYTVSFKLNAQGKITDIILLVDYELITN